MRFIKKKPITYILLIFLFTMVFNLNAEEQKNNNTNKIVKISKAKDIIKTDGNYTCNTVDILTVNNEENFIYTDDEKRYYYNEKTKFIDKQGTEIGIYSFVRGSRVKFCGVESHRTVTLKKASYIKQAW